MPQKFLKRARSSTHLLKSVSENKDSIKKASKMKDELPTPMLKILVHTMYKVFQK